MYKVFFNDRIVFLTDEKEEPKTDERKLVYSYHNSDDLKNVLSHFNRNPGILSITLVHSDADELFRIFSSLFYFIEAAGGVVKNNNSEILVIFRYTKWDLPKGKIDKEENPEKAAIREISEECGITGQKIIRKLTDTYHTYTEKNEHILKKTYWFELSYNGTEKLKPQLNEDISKVVWINPGKMNFVFENTYESIKEVLYKAGISE